MYNRFLRVSTRTNYPVPFRDAFRRHFIRLSYEPFVSIKEILLLLSIATNITGIFARSEEWNVII